MPAIRHDYPFDPTYGLDRAAVQAIGAPPATEGFAAFWREARAEALAVPLRLERDVPTTPAPGWRLSVVRFDGLGGMRIGAWLLEPEGPCRSGLVMGHGYGGRADPPVIAPSFPQPEPTAILAPCMPGFHLSARADLPATAMTHVVHGIDDPRTYLLRSCVAALWAATRALAELRPEAAGRLAYEGGSFGGGLGALAAPWEPLWSCVRLDIPTFGHHPWRLRCPCEGSGKAVQALHRTRPEITSTLAFYDAAVAATLAHQPALIAPADFDPKVPPPGQWAVANAWAGPHEILPRTSGHFDGPWTAAEQQEAHRRWVELRRRHQLG